MRWFRMYSEFATDPKVQMMSEAHQRRLVMLFCLQSSGELEGLDDEEIAFAMRLDIETLHETFHVFHQRGFLDEKNRLRNWDKRQFKSDTSTERVRKYREKSKENDDETLQKRYKPVTVTPPDTDTDTDTDTEKNSKPEAEKISFDFSSGKFSGITPQKRSLWQQAYPAVNLETEIKRAAVWLIENPKNKKSNYGKFLTSWLSRTQDKAPKVKSNGIDRMPSPAGG